MTTSETPPSGSDTPWCAPSVVVATVAWVGRLRPAPGTWGALVGVPLSLGTGWLAVRLASELSGFVAVDGGRLAFGCEALVLAILNLAAVPICTRAARRLGRGHDPAAIVIDETASLPVGMLVIPFIDRSWDVLLIGWLLHRVFDISKPYPCRRLERLPGGLGIMADDLAAAAWMAASLAAIRWAGFL